MIYKSNVTNCRSTKKKIAECHLDVMCNTQKNISLEWNFRQNTDDFIFLSSVKTTNEKKIRENSLKLRLMYLYLSFETILKKSTKKNQQEKSA